MVSKAVPLLSNQRTKLSHGFINYDSLLCTGGCEIRIKMEKKFRQTVYQFKQFEPSKRFSSFNYTDLTWNQVVAGYCNKGEILKIDGVYYIFAGEIYNDWNEKRPSIIRFKQRGKTVKEINA